MLSSPLSSYVTPSDDTRVNEASPPYVIRLPPSPRALKLPITRLQTITVHAAVWLPVDRKQVQFSDTRSSRRSKLRDCFGYLETAMVAVRFAHLITVLELLGRSLSKIKLVT